jgi:hypothetical protein
MYLGVDRSGHIIANALTDATADDALTGVDLIEGITGAVASLTADAAYDTIAFYAVAAARGARVVVPPAKTPQCWDGDRARGSRSDDSDGDGHRTTTVDEGIGLPSAGSRGERLLPLQVDLRGCSSSSQSKRAGGRDTRRMQGLESDD